MLVIARPVYLFIELCTSVANSFSVICILCMFLRFVFKLHLFLLGLFGAKTQAGSAFGTPSFGTSTAPAFGAAASNTGLFGGTNTGSSLFSQPAAQPAGLYMLVYIVNFLLIFEQSIKF